jgi:FtsZ-binding cell division protein ZapB
MSAEFLESLEARVAQAIDRLAALAEENEELRQRIAGLEGELASKSEVPSTWKKEREEIRRRVERLVEKLSALG